MTLQFSDCILPISPREFISEYRGRQVAHFPGTRAKYASLVDSLELSQALSRITVNAGVFRVLSPDGQVPADELLTAPFAANRDRRAIRAAVLEDHLSRGATMILEHCESVFESVHAMCEMLAAALTARVNGCLFVVYQPGKPSGLHWDDRDMVICQVAGRKKWPVYKPIYDRPLFDPKRAGGPMPSAEHFRDFILEPGDGLYLPRGWPHNPEGLDGHSVHVAFSVATPTGIDLLDWIKRDLTRDCAEMRTDLPVSHSAAERHLFAERVRQAVMDRLTDEVIDSYYQRHRLNVYSRPVKLPVFDAAVVEP